MSLFTCLVAFLVETAYPVSQFHQKRQRLLDWLIAKKPSPESSPNSLYVKVFIYLLVPVLLVSLLNALFGYVSSFFEFIVHVFVLWVCMGYQPLHQVFNDVRFALGRGDLTYANRVYQKFSTSHDASHGLTQVDLSAHELSLTLSKHVAWLVYTRLFSILFYYAILPGVMGPILYTMSCLLSRAWHDDSHPILSEIVQKIQALMNFIPLRLTVLSFALVSSFENVMVRWRMAPETTPEERFMQAFQGGIEHDPDSTSIDLPNKAKTILDQSYRLLVRSGFVWGTALILWCLITL